MLAISPEKMALTASSSYVHGRLATKQSVLLGSPAGAPTGPCDVRDRHLGDKHAHVRVRVHDRGHVREPCRRVHDRRPRRPRSKAPRRHPSGPRPRRRPHRQAWGDDRHRDDRHAVQVSARGVERRRTPLPRPPRAAGAAPSPPSSPRPAAAAASAAALGTRPAASIRSVPLVSATHGPTWPQRAWRARRLRKDQLEPLWRSHALS